MIKWDDGLNIGIKSLDDEHKNLLDIVNQLYESIYNNEAEDIIEFIYDKLLDSTISHNNNEELILKECNYAELSTHKQYHVDMITKMKLIKTELTNASGYMDAQNIHKHLIELLLTHIITEDMPLDKTFKTCNLIETSYNKLSWFDKLLIKTSETFSFTKRLLLSALIPLMGMLILGLISLWNHYNDYAHMKNISDISHMISDVDQLAHNLQIERGLSCGHVSSKKSIFKGNLKEHYLILNKNIEVFNSKFDKIKYYKINNIRTNIKQLKSDIKTLDNVRKDIQNKNISKKDIILLYTNIINNILEITSKIAIINNDEEITIYTLSLSSILKFKESLGLERAFGTIFIEQKNIDTQEYERFKELSNTQKKYLSEYRQRASKKHKEMLNSFIENSKIKELTAYRDDIKNKNIKNLDSQKWFSVMTEYINSIKQFENHLLSDINTLIDNNTRKALKNITLWFVYTIFMFISTIFILYLFERSSKLQIYQIVNAIKHLADGDRSLRLDPSMLNDEMSLIKNAYEKTRQELLVADIYTQLYKNQKEAELKNKQTQNIKLEKMAFVDSLTGLTNRRKFEELSKLELERSIRYKNELSFLMLDIDHFKEVNDIYGHSIGDEVLKHFASTCLKMARGIDIVARIGGEEFVVILPETGKSSAYIFAERFRKKIFNSKLEIEKNQISYSVSIGIATLELGQDKDVDIILQKADKALYEAKNTGRNKTIIYN